MSDKVENQKPEEQEDEDNTSPKGGCDRPGGCGCAG